MERKNPNKLKISIIHILDKVCNKETITYVIAGVCTTIVNYFSYALFCNVIGIENMIANTIAWVIAVVFAFVVNDRWVFQKQNLKNHTQIQKFTKFISARIVTFIVEQIGMFIFINILSFPNLIVKAFIAVIITILNYLLSKLFVFRT